MLKDLRRHSRLMCFSAIAVLVLSGLLNWHTAPASAQNKTGWTMPKTISDPQEHATDPYLVSDPRNNRLHVFWASERVYANGNDDTSVIFYAYKDLNTDLWSTPVDILRTGNGLDAFAPRAVLDGEGTIHLFFSAPDLRSPFGPIYYTSAPAETAGTTAAWRSPTELTGGSYMSDAKIDNQGFIHVVYASITEDSAICHLLSGDNGQTWEKTSCFPSRPYLRNEEAHTRPRLAIDRADRLHVVWMIDDYSNLSTLRYGGRALMYGRSSDGGLTWENIHTIDQVDGRQRASVYYSSDDLAESLRTAFNPPVTVDLFQPEWPNILVDNTGRVHIIWIGSQAMTRMHIWSEDGGDHWTKPAEAMPVVYFNGWMGLVADSADHLHYISAGRDGVWYANWAAETGWSKEENIDMVGPEMGYIQAVIMNGNRIFAVWQKESSAAGGGPRTIVVSELQTETAAITDPLPPIREVVLPAAALRPNRASSQAATLTPRPTFAPDRGYPAANSPAAPIFWSALPVLLILGVVIFAPVLFRRQ